MNADTESPQTAAAAESSTSRRVSPLRPRLFPSSASVLPPGSCHGSLTPAVSKRSSHVTVLASQLSVTSSSSRSTGPDDSDRLSTITVSVPPTTVNAVSVTVAPSFW